MGLISPIKSSDKTVTLKHWQRVWIDRHGEINFSGLAQILITEIIKAHDPKYYTQNKQYIDMSLIRKKEVIEHIVKTTPIISS